MDILLIFMDYAVIVVINNEFSMHNNDKHVKIGLPIKI